MKKIWILVLALLLTVNVAIAAVYFSQTTKAEYQKRYDNLLNKAATYITISAPDRAFYQKQCKDGLDEIEKIMNDPNIPDEIKKSTLNSLNESLSAMESELNNPNIPVAQKIAGIKEVLQSMKTKTAIQQEDEQAKQKEEQERIALEKRYQEELRRMQEEARKKQLAEQEELKRKEEEARKKQLAEQEKLKLKQEEARKKQLAEQEELRKVQEEQQIKKECVVKVSGLCFQWPDYNGYPNISDDFWAASDRACKARNMSLPTIKQLQIYYNYVVAQDPGLYAVGITKLWSSELDGKYNAYILQGYMNETKILSWPRHHNLEAICVKQVSSTSPLYMLQDYYGLQKTIRKGPTVDSF